MSDGWQQWGALLQFVLTAVFFGWLAFAFSRRKRRPSPEVADEPEGTPYRIFSRQHDLVVRGRDVVGKLRSVSSDRLRGWMLTNPALWRTWVERADAFYAASLSDATEFSAVIENGGWSDCSICLLFDQSGSMKGEPMACCAAAARSAAETLHGAGAEIAVLGFSTVGWQGGNTASVWRSAGSPKRPGRLCSLLHIEYQSFAEPMSREDWEAMMHPDVFRENVDGEALEWAASILLSSGRQKKLLIVVSDGAPVDDMTLMHNGPSYLWHHLMGAIAKLEADERLTLAALGVNYRVNEYYSNSDTVLNLDKMPKQLLALITHAAGRAG